MRTPRHVLRYPVNADILINASACIYEEFP